MRTIRILLLLSAVWAILSPEGARAQWRVAAPRLLDSTSLPGGAITYRDGMVWAGRDALYSSADSGVTWQRNALTFTEPGDYIFDIQFFDRNFGLVTTYHGLYLTTTGGASWKNLQPDNFSPGASGCFAGNPDTIIAAWSAPGTVFVSTDRGRTWRTGQVNDLGRQLLYRKGALYFFTAKDLPSLGGALFRSSNGGASWQQLLGVFDQDCYSFAFDSCKGNAYVVNEAIENTFNTSSNILVSTDEGASWQVSISQDLSYFSGAIALGTQSSYVTTVSDGVLRSIDNGVTWIPIGGPNCNRDEIAICAINDNLLLALDTAGSVWRTTNSGGQPVPNMYSPPTLAGSDLFTGTATSICSYASASVLIQPYTGITCTPPTIVAEWIDGPGSVSFALTHAPTAALTQLDSLVLRFAPDSVGQHNATLNIRLSDGTIWKVALAGRGADSENVLLNPQNITTDTIGEISLSVHVGRIGVSSFDLPITYDTAVLVYEGTFDSQGTRLDIATLAAGNALIHINGSAGQAVDSLDITARFAFYPTAQKCGTVTFGPGRFTPDTTICGSIKATTAQICSHSACGETMLSDFLRYGRRPAFRITPNPASSTMEITSQEPVANATIEVLNALGRVELRETANLSGDAFVTNLAGLTPGPRFVRILTAHGVQVLPMLILR